MSFRVCNHLEEERADCFTFIVCEKGFINVQDSLFNVPLIGLWGLCVGPCFLMHYISVISSLQSS